MQAASSPLAAIAADSRSLDALRNQAKNDPDRALKDAAKQFEALFMQMLLKSMRDALPQSDFLANDASRTYTGMLDTQLAQNMSGKGIGLAELMVRQLTQGKGNPLEKGAQGAAAGPRSLAPPLEKLAQASAAGAAGGAPQEFVDRMLPHALEASQASGVPARFILGQAALESGWGRGEIRGAGGAASHNLFGIKAGAGWQGRTVAVATTEYVDGRPVKTVETFRAYDSYAEGFRDWAQLVSRNPRYAAAVAPGNDAASFAQGLARGGYATDPAYAAKLTRVINSSLLAQRGLG
jgi:flagellar protein FlgJ